MSKGAKVLTTGSQHIQNDPNQHEMYFIWNHLPCAGDRLSCDHYVVAYHHSWLYHKAGHNDSKIGIVVEPLFVKKMYLHDTDTHKLSPINMVFDLSSAMLLIILVHMYQMNFKLILIPRLNCKFLVLSLLHTSIKWYCRALNWYNHSSCSCIVHFICCMHSIDDHKPIIMLFGLIRNNPLPAIMV